MQVHQPYARMWVMFGGYARDTCMVEFNTVGDGVPEPLDRFALFGYEDRSHAPNWLRLVKQRDEGAGVAGRICRELGPDADLRMSVSCMHGNEGWRVVSDPALNQCEIDVAPLRRR
ncbi:MAG: hypothetical protein KC912_24775 [Proteobacteria bacterium]|nr:hypothetical protein [Pseudomonadota bacterium]